MLRYGFGFLYLFSLLVLAMPLHATEIPGIEIRIVPDPLKIESRSDSAAALEAPWVQLALEIHNNSLWPLTAAMVHLRFINEDQEKFFVMPTGESKNFLEVLPGERRMTKVFYCSSLPSAAQGYDVEIRLLGWWGPISDPQEGIYYETKVRAQGGEVR